jgi:hypothetical protein
MFFGGSRSCVIANDIEGGVTGIAFIYNRSTASRFAPFVQHVVANNRVGGHSEEGITFDVRGNEASNIGCVEADAVASVDSSGGTNRVVLDAAGWSASPELAYYQYWMTFLSGALAGRSYRIDGHPEASARFDFPDTELTDADHGLIAPGDLVSIGVPALSNVITGNTVDCAASESEAADYGGAGIAHWGNVLFSAIAGNTVIDGEIVLRSLEGLAKPSPSYSDALGKAPVMHCAVSGNTVDRGNIRFGYKGYGDFTDNPSYQSIGCAATGNVVSGGSIIADAHQVIASGNVATSFETANGGAINP